MCQPISCPLTARIGLEVANMPVLRFKGQALVLNHHLAVPYQQTVPREKLSLASIHGLSDNLIIHGDNLAAFGSQWGQERPNLGGQRGWVGEFAFPDHQRLITKAPQCSHPFRIAQLGPLQFRHPVAFVRTRHVDQTTLWVLMLMPEAAVQENHPVPTEEDQVRFAGQPADMKSVAKAELTY